MSRWLRVLITVLMCGALAGGTAWAESGGGKKADPKAAKGEGGKVPAVQGVENGPVFYDMPDILVNLDTGSQKPVYLKVKVAIQIAKATDADKIEAFKPRILDDLLLYLREMRLESLRNPKSLDRLRQELLMRVQQAVKPVKVNDILFREFLVQ